MKPQSPPEELCYFRFYDERGVERTMPLPDAWFGRLYRIFPHAAPLGFILNCWPQFTREDCDWLRDLVWERYELRRAERRARAGRPVRSFRIVQGGAR